jgi:hypothetical protein
MSVIVLKVVPKLNRWIVKHNDMTLASFATKPEAERCALAVAKHHPPRDMAQLDLTQPDGGVSGIRVF